MNCDTKDMVQVLSINTAGIGISIAEVNEMLTLLALILSIVFTIYKFTKYDGKK